LRACNSKASVARFRRVLAESLACLPCITRTAHTASSHTHLSQATTQVTMICTSSDLSAAFLPIYLSMRGAPVVDTETANQRDQRPASTAPYSTMRVVGKLGSPPLAGYVAWACRLQVVAATSLDVVYRAPLISAVSLLNVYKTSLAARWP